MLSNSSSRCSLLKRFFNIHEYQSKQLMRKHGVTVEKFEVAVKPDEVSKAVTRLALPKVAIKSQIHAGGRGKGYFKENGYKGGVQIVVTAPEAKFVSSKMFGNHLVTKQTGSEGKKVNCVMVAEAKEVQRELYFAILLDRVTQGPMIVCSPRGGTSIEEVAEESPELIGKYPVDYVKGPSVETKKAISKFLGFDEGMFPKVSREIDQLYSLFKKTDSIQIEINPLAETYSGEVVSLDAKFNFDDSADFRQQEIFDMADLEEEDPREMAAKKFGSSFVSMDGSIGCMVNGAGLAMSTMDAIKMSGGEPANFLDLGGSAGFNTVFSAFKLISSVPKVNTILVNIFGGIMKCDLIAEGIIEAVKQIGLKVPLVVRLEGTNVEKGKKLLKESGLPIITANDLGEAAEKAVKASKEFATKKKGGHL